MPYDLFISYSRRDNEQGRITQLVERIKTDFAPFAKRELVPFFDQQEIGGMQDWRQRILQGLRESRLLLACLSPAYLKSEYCEMGVCRIPQIRNRPPTRLQWRRADLLCRSAGLGKQGFRAAMCRLGRRTSQTSALRSAPVV